MFIKFQWGLFPISDIKYFGKMEEVFNPDCENGTSYVINLHMKNTKREDDNPYVTFATCDKDAHEAEWTRIKSILTNEAH